MTNEQNNNGKPETYTDGCRGAWIPREILDLFLNGTVSSTELLLLISIDLLEVTHSGGCSASNEWISKERMGGLQADTISKMISRLKKLGLLIDIGDNGKNRLLVTRWSKMYTNPESEQ